MPDLSHGAIWPIIRNRELGDVPWRPSPQGKETQQEMGKKIVAETRFIGMYVFAMSIVIMLVALTYTMMFDMSGALPVTKICNIIIICASGIGIVYAYLAADSSEEQKLARTYARRDAVIIATMSIYFVTIGSVLGMVTDAMSRGISIIPMMSLPATMAGAVIMGASVTAMILLTILDHVAKAETARIERRRQGDVAKPRATYDGNRVVTTTREARDSNVTSKAYFDDGALDAGEIQNFIPLTQMGVSRIRPDNKVLQTSMSMAAKRQQDADMERKAAHEKMRSERSEARKKRIVEATSNAREWAMRLCHAVGAGVTATGAGAMSVLTGIGTAIVILFRHAGDGVRRAYCQGREALPVFFASLRNIFVSLRGIFATIFASAIAFFAKVGACVTSSAESVASFTREHIPEVKDRADQLLGHAKEVADSLAQRRKQPEGDATDEETTDASLDELTPADDTTAIRLVSENLASFASSSMEEAGGDAANGGMGTDGESLPNMAPSAVTDADAPTCGRDHGHANDIIPDTGMGGAEAEDAGEEPSPMPTTDAGHTPQGVTDPLEGIAEESVPPFLRAYLRSRRSPSQGDRQ